MSSPEGALEGLPSHPDKGWMGGAGRGPGSSGDALTVLKATANIAIKTPFSKAGSCLSGDGGGSSPPSAASPGQVLLLRSTPGTAPGTVQGADILGDQGQLKRNALSREGGVSSPSSVTSQGCSSESR